MPRLRDIQNGAVVSCSDETAILLGPGWVPAETPTPVKTAPASNAAPVKRPVAKKAAASKTEK